MAKVLLEAIGAGHQGAQALLGHSVEQPPLWQKIFVKPSELKATDGAVNQADGYGHQLAKKWRTIACKALAQHRHLSAMKSDAAVCAEGTQRL